MTRDAWIVGLGQLGGVFAHALLRRGYRVQGLLRGEAAPLHATEPALALIAVGEADREAAAQAVPPSWPKVFVQNDLVLDDLEDQDTVAVVWFEKKAATGITPILSTPIAGPRAEVIAAALGALDIPAPICTRAQLATELAAKNAYITGFNVLGLAFPQGERVAEVSADPRFAALQAEIFAVERARTQAAIDLALANARVIEAVQADPAHLARGRSAPARLARFLERARALGVPTPIAEAIDAGC